MITARKHGRYGPRDALMVLLAYVHGFRASELVRLQWSEIDWDRGLIHCRRVKNGTNTDHPLTGQGAKRASEAQGRTEARQSLPVHD
jgi:integrase